MSPADIFCKLFGRFVRPDLEPNHLTLWLYFWIFRKSYSADEENSFVFVVCRFLDELFQNNLSWIPSECQIVWIQIRPDVLTVLIWVQTACEDYQQTTEVKIVIFFILTIQNQRCHLHALLSLSQIWTHSIKKCNEIALRAVSRFEVYLTLLDSMVIFIVFNTQSKKWGYKKSFKETKSATMNIFRNFLFSF